jgi:hypothetical protein
MTSEAVASALTCAGDAFDVDLLSIHSDVFSVVGPVMEFIEERTDNCKTVSPQKGREACMTSD